MSKKIILLLLLSWSTLSAQYLDWYKRMGGDTECRIYSMTQGNGYVYSFGAANGTTDFDPDNGGLSFTCPNGAMFVTKHDSAGNLIWVKTFTSVTGGASTADIEVDSWDNVYLVGGFSGVFDFDPDTGTYNLGPSYANTQAYVLKLDMNGHFKWAQHYSGSLGENSAQAVTTIGNKILVTGSFDDTVDFNSGVGTNNLITSGGNDIFMLEIDTAGNFIWAKKMGSSGGETGTDIKVDGNNYIILTGVYQDGCDMDPTAGIHNLYTTDSPFEYFICKYTSTGNLYWAKSIHGDQDELTHHLAIDDFNNIYTGGSFVDTIDIDPGGGVYNLIAPFATQALYVTKWDENGIFKWAEQITGNEHSAMQSLCMNDRFIFYTGYLWGNYDFDPSSDTCFLNSSTPYDAFIAAVDTGGNFVTAMQMRGSGTNWGTDLAMNNDELYLAGLYTDSIDIDPTSLVEYIHAVNTVSVGNSFIVKLGLQGIGIEEQNLNLQCLVYPNPTESSITISSFTELKNANIYVMDMHGRLVLKKINLSGNQQIIDLQNLADGMYLIQIASQTGSAKLKVVKRSN
jgi:hypothetical protein